MDPIRIYEYLTIARGRIFDQARPLTPEQLNRAFPIGPGSIARTLTHAMISEWYYVWRIEGHIEPHAGMPLDENNPPPLAALEATWAEQAQRTRGAIQSVRDWNSPMEYRVIDDDGHPMLVRASRADVFTQLALHEVHHRAQVMNMLRQLGITAQDLDFNALMYTRRPA